MDRYLRNKASVVSVPITERWKYYIAREYFASIPIIDNRENLVGLQVLLDQQIKVEPIWMEDELDEEGIAYAEYLKIRTLPGWVRISVANKLAIAATSLRMQGYILVLKAGYRPVEVQQKLFDDVLAGFRVKYPKLGDGSLMEMTRDYVSDPSQIVAPHTAGGAVDVMLRSMDNGSEVDMGCEVNKGETIAWADNDLIDEQQKKNRSVLRDAMLAAGFAPIGSEWWHYSYGDQLWAAYYDKPLAVYGIYDK